MPLCQLLCQMAFSSHLLAVPAFPGVVTENSVRSENTGGSIIREIMVANTMSSLFVAFFALIAPLFEPVLPYRRRSSRFVTNLQFSKRTRRAACAPPLRPALVGGVVPRLVRLAAMSRDGSARHCSPLAPESFRLALDQKIAPPSRQARSCGEHS
jgi:hypothetical protein